MSDTFVKIDEKKVKALWLLCFLCFVAIFCVQWFEPIYQIDREARAAAENFEKARIELKAYRGELGIAIDTRIDPKETGMLGCDYSDLTSTVGDLEAKQLSVNATYAALITAWLKKSGVQKGDTVAATFSGSFPALNLATLCAFDALQVKGIVFSSVGASVYGANIPGFTWLEMERRLLDKGLLVNHTSYASLGGIVDAEGGIDGTGFDLGEAAITRHGATYVREGTPKTVSRDVKRRMDIFFASGTPKAFVNVGGNVTSLGWVAEAALLGNGLLKRAPKTTSEQRGVIFRMIERNVPVIHLLNIKRLNDRHNVQPYRESEDLERIFLKARATYLKELFALLLLWLSLALVCVLKLRRFTPKDFSDRTAHFGNERD